MVKGVLSECVGDNGTGVNMNSSYGREKQSTPSSTLWVRNQKTKQTFIHDGLPCPLILLLSHVKPCHTPIWILTTLNPALNCRGDTAPTQIFLLRPRSLAIQILTSIHAPYNWISAALATRMLCIVKDLKYCFGRLIHQHLCIQLVVRCEMVELLNVGEGKLAWIIVGVCNTGVRFRVGLKMW